MNTHTIQLHRVLRTAPENCSPVSGNMQHSTAPSGAFGQTGVRGKPHGMQGPDQVLAAITSRTMDSGAGRMLARPSSSITTKRISPPSAFLSTCISAR